MTDDRQIIVTSDSEAGIFSFPGTLLVDVNREAGRLRCGVRIYRGTHEWTGRHVVCCNVGNEHGDHARAAIFETRSELDFFLAWDAPDLTSTGDVMVRACMHEVLAQLGGSN